MCQFDSVNLRETLQSDLPRGAGPKPIDHQLHLQTVDHVDVTILVDNTTDILLASTDRVARPPLAWDWSERPQLIAEHGYALLLTTHHKGATRSVLYDQA